MTPGIGPSRLSVPCALAVLAVLAVPGAHLSAQENAESARVRALNNRVLALHDEWTRAQGGGGAALRAQAVAVARERAAALETLIGQDVRRALTLIFSEDLAGRLAAAFPEAAVHLESHGVWRGPIEYLIYDDHSMTNHTSLILMETPQGPLSLHFPGGAPEALKSGDVLELRGVRSGKNLLADANVVLSTAAAESCSPLGEQKVAVLLVTFPGFPTPSVTPQQVRDIFFAQTGRSVDGFWREASYGKAWATGDVLGWYTLDQVYTCDNHHAMRDAAIRAADAAVDFRNYNRVFVIFPSSGNCGWAGVASMGCRTLNSPGDGDFTASNIWMLASYFANRDQGVKLATHEGGHGLGLGHAASRDFGSETLGPVGVKGAVSEYGDVFSTMGSWNLGHYGAPHKLKLGWLDAASVATVEANGAYSLQPLETSPAGLQALKVRRGAGNDAWLWVEYRQKLGNYDTTLNSQVFSGALIHYEDLYTRAANGQTQLLDFTPETSAFTDPALAAGRSWVDAYTSLSLWASSASQNALNVSVNYGAAPCVPSNPGVTISPPNPSVAAGSPVSYSVAVTNNDSPGCSATTWTFTSAAPAGWGSAISPASIALTPGQSGTVTLTKTPPEGTPPGTYEVDLSAAVDSRSARGTANCTVTVPPPPLTMTLLVAGSTFAAKSTVPITTSVLSGSAPAAGAFVEFTLTDPGGGKTTKTVTADAKGSAAWNYKLTPAAPKGVYRLTATSTYGSQEAFAGPETFTVQ